MIVSQEKEILLYKEAGNAYASRRTSVTVETVGKKPVLETSPSLAGPSTASALGQPGHRRSLARLSRRARALRLLRPPRRRLELPRRQGPPAPLPRRGRPGRRRHRAHNQPRHAAEPADRVRPRLVRPQIGQDTRSGTGHRPPHLSGRRFPEISPSSSPGGTFASRLFFYRSMNRSFTPVKNGHRVAEHPCRGNL